MCYNSISSLNLRADLFVEEGSQIKKNKGYITCISISIRCNTAVSLIRDAWPAMLAEAAHERPIKSIM